MLLKNQVYEAKITDYTTEGQGIAHIEGCAVFIPNAIAGEKVLVRSEKARKTWAAGKRPKPRKGRRGRSPRSWKNPPTG